MFDEFDKYVLDKIEQRRENGSPFEVLFEELYDISLSETESRKELRGIENHLNFKKETSNKENKQDELKYKTTIEINNNGTQTSDKLLQMSEENCKDVEYLLKAHGYDSKVFTLLSARNNIWNAYSKQDGIQTLYSSKIVVKPKVEYVWNAEDIKKLFESIKTKFPQRLDIKSNKYEVNGKLLIVPIADFHFGLLAEKMATGNDYNLDIAESIFYYTLHDVLDRVGNREFEKVLFVVGNDFINFDNLSGTTTKLTPQDNCSLWFNVVNRATQLIIDGIDMLTHIAPVEVAYVPSNHDMHTMYGIMQTLKAWYKDSKNVGIDDSPLPRKYFRFYKNLIPLSHDLKTKDALQIITTEAKTDWSSCNHIITLLAHLHQAMIYEKQGYLEIMRLPTVSGFSRWSNNQGYVQTEKKNQSLIVDSELGITDVINTIII